MDNKYLNLKDSAEFLGCSKGHLYHLVQDGMISHSKPTGGKIIFRRQDLEDFMKKGYMPGNSKTT